MNKIKNLRIQLCLSSTEFATLLGLKYNTIWNYENGLRAPSFKVMRKMIDLAKKAGFVITVDDIRGDV